MKRAGPVLQAALSLLLLSATPSASPVRQGAGEDIGFSDVQAALREFNYPRALELANWIEDEVLASQSRFHVLHHGGDLRGALAEGRKALERFPDDLYLLDQTAYIAATLGASIDLDRLLAHVLELGDKGLAPIERVDKILTRHRESALILRDRRQKSQQSSRRARITVALLGSLTLLLLIALARRPPQSELDGTPEPAL